MEVRPTAKCPPSPSAGENRVELTIHGRGGPGALRVKRAADDRCRSAGPRLIAKLEARRGGTVRRTPAARTGSAGCPWVARDARGPITWQAPNRRQLAEGAPEATAAGGLCRGRDSVRGRDPAADEPTAGGRSMLEDWDPLGTRLCWVAGPGQMRE